MAMLVHQGILVFKVHVFQVPITIVMMEIHVQQTIVTHRLDALTRQIVMLAAMAMHVLQGMYVIRVFV